MPTFAFDNKEINVLKEVIEKKIEEALNSFEFVAVPDPESSNVKIRIVRRDK